MPPPSYLKLLSTREQQAFIMCLMTSNPEATTLCSKVVPLPPPSLTPEERQKAEERGREFDRKLEEHLKKTDEKIQEAKRLEVPLHKLIPVN